MFNKNQSNILFSAPSVHIKGNFEIYLESCKRIEEYNDVFIKVRCKNLFIQIWGSGLKAYDFKTDDLVIKGKISQIELIEKR